MTRLTCSLCASTSDPTYIAQIRISLCAFCLSALRDSASVSGRQLRSALRYLRRRVFLKKKGLRRHRPETLRKCTRTYLQTPAGQLKNKARCAVTRAIRAGKIVRPKICPECGSEPPFDAAGRSEIHFHHTNGYDLENQLVGRFLCRDCHHDLDAAAS